MALSIEGRLAVSPRPRLQGLYGYARERRGPLATQDGIRKRLG